MQFLDLTLESVAADLALEEALLRDLDERPGAPGLLRVWSPPAFAVVLGASGRLREEVEQEACAADGVAIARRSSGGGTVLIGPGALNIALFFPIGAAAQLGAVETAQSWVMERIGRAIAAAGRPVELRGSGDLAIGDRKVAGSAQRRLRRAVLVHATLLDRFPLDRIGRYLRPPRRQPEYRRRRDHDSFVANLGLGRDLLVSSIRREWGIGEGAAAPEPPLATAGELLRSTYENPTWVERF